MSHRAVYKTTTAEFLDEFYSGVSRPRSEAYADALALMDLDSLSDSTRDLESRDSGALDAGAASDFEAHWLASSAKHGAAPVERILRLGYREAVELASAHNLPIENFWVTGTGDDFELHICETADRIIVFMFVPNEGLRPYGSTRAQSRSWVVRAGDIDVRETRRVHNSIATAHQS